MRGLVRILLMFGPMIFRQIQKYQRNKQREQYRQPQRDRRHVTRREQVPSNRQERPQSTQPDRNIGNNRQERIERTPPSNREGDFVDPINNDGENDKGFNWKNIFFEKE